jgi:trypsin-like peptidase
LSADSQQLGAEHPARISPSDLNCAFYLYPSEDAARAGAGLGGSGFWVSVRSNVVPEFWWLYAVSNRHVVHSHGASVIRANTKDGSRRIIDSEPTDWVEHPNGHDIAVLPMGEPHPDIELVSVVTGMFAERHDMYGRISVRDEVFMIGRFVNHEGRARNTPSARFGNISMFPDEPIYIDSKTPPQESFAVELRSTCGYSGSPVFVDVESPIKNFYGSVGKLSLLLGVHWGHIVEPWTVETKIIKKVMQAGLDHDEREVDQVSANTGMNGVVPAWRLKELLDLPRFKKVREAEENEELERRKTAPGANSDAASGDS